MKALRVSSTSLEIFPALKTLIVSDRVEDKNFPGFFVVFLYVEAHLTKDARMNP